jgi:DEAD/DEAH box helicase domain-containing protein
VEARNPESGQPAVIVYDAIPGGVGLSPRLVALWETLATAARERVTACACTSGCPSCVGPAGDSEPGAKEAVQRLLKMI